MSPNMTFTIRPASLTDLPSIATLDIAAHQPNSAVLNMNILPLDDIHTLYLSRYSHFMSQPMNYRFLVATVSKDENTPRGETGGFLDGPKVRDSKDENATNGDIVGFLVGVRPREEGSEDLEWNPVFPDDADEEKIIWFSGLKKLMKEDKMKYFKNDMWELEALATSPSYQRCGVGSLLLREWLQEVDIANGTLYVRASRAGVPLYEKIGCVNKGEHSVDVSDRGWSKPIINTNMIRSARGRA